MIASVEIDVLAPAQVLATNEYQHRRLDDRNLLLVIHSLHDKWDDDAVVKELLRLGLGKGWITVRVRVGARVTFNPGSDLGYGRGQV